MSVSIIIPTLNEATCLRATLCMLRSLDPSPLEIILSDGGSEDGTVAIGIEELGSQIIELENSAVGPGETTETGAKAIEISTIATAPRISPTIGHGTIEAPVLPPNLPGETGFIRILQTTPAQRARQMNRGAQVARGTILCFLHADTQVPPDLVTLLETTLQDPETAAVGFISLMSGPLTTRWGISFHNYLKTYYAALLFYPWAFFSKGLRILFGDQVIACRTREFDRCGGFDSSLAIMEDADLCLRLNDYGRIRMLNRVVQSSDRRVAHWGPWKANFLYLAIGILWGLGVDSHYLKQFYQDIR
ncbi:MAG: glycosyltransferase [Prochlorothrix sp.]|nr:glycosyltransferase [Prochlorothrix sp.]